ncbi:MAG: arabinose efflux permease family protein, partial [Phycisphaerales bacterium]|nr:arabinose efflux permease family protein [Phycisphaerales bacterium]
MASDLSSNPAAAAAGSPAPGGPAAAIPLNYQEAPKPKSAWSPLAVPIFRALWIAYLVSLIGTWAREAGGPWLMGILTDKQKDSALWVSLIQTASNLPIAFLSIAAGVMADIYDRRRLLIWTNVWMLVASAALAVMTITGHINRESLLIMTLVLG